MLNNGTIESKLLIEQHFHGAYGVDFANCNVEEVLELSKKLIQNGIGGFFPTLATDCVENIKKQIQVFKSAKMQQTSDMADILGIHLEGIFLNPLKKGIHDESQFMDLTIENFQRIEDEFIKIVTLAPELDKDFKLTKYLKDKGIKVQAGHCTGSNLSLCDGVTHLFNAMSPITHRDGSTSLSALINDDLYTEIIADSVHLSDEIINLVFKSKPNDKIILISDCLPITNSDKSEMEFCNKTIYYDGVKATDKNGVIAGSTTLLDKIVKILGQKHFDVINLIDNIYKYHNVEINGRIFWSDNFEILKVEKNSRIIYNK
ncbi:hypothetical protein IJG72_00760 [bacterium]|nr:hypothetical protein [bacterium]